MRRMVWTRAADDWEIDRALIEKAGLSVLRLPCVRTQSRSPAGTAPFPYYVFTSAKAVREAMRHPGLASAVGQARCCYTHGAKTAETLKAFGANIEKIQARTAEEMGHVLLRKIPKGAPIGIPGTAEPAFDMAGFLRQEGFAAHAIVLYETVIGLWDERGAPLSDERREELGSALEGAVAFASPSAVRGFAQGFAAHLTRLGKSLVACAIGPTTAKAAEPYFEDVRVAPSSTVGELLSLLEAAFDDDRA